MELLITHIIHCLQSVYDASEARAVARRLLEESSLGWSPVRIFAGTEDELSIEEREQLQLMLERLCRQEPLQYVLGHEWFDGLCFKVGPGVLIPRPETQDLVAWVVSDVVASHNENALGSCSVLDACTGSGCIAVSLAARLPQATVQALDVSDTALAYARQNALDNQVQVNFMHCPLEEYRGVKRVDVLVSNPPYITDSERSNMEERVTTWEPGLALFVPDDDPLRFYRLLADTGLRELRQGGALYVEINSRFGCEVCQLFESVGYRNVELRNDRFGLPRMIKGIK